MQIIVPIYNFKTLATIVDKYDPDISEVYMMKSILSGIDPRLRQQFMLMFAQSLDTEYFHITCTSYVPHHHFDGVLYEDYPLEYFLSKVRWWLKTQYKKYTR